VPDLDAAAIAEELTADLERIADRDQADITPREFDRAMSAYWNLRFAEMAERRGQLR
jgi:hypothetical protein